MARVYAIASAKGGVGKTTTTANLGSTLAETGAEVVVIDGDIGMANLGAALGVDPTGPTLHDVLAGETAPQQAAYEGPAGLTVVPGDTSLDSFAAADPQRLEHVVEAFDDADFILIDVGAGVSHETSIPLSVADAVVLVSTAERDALVDTEKTRQLTERLGGVVAGAVITRTDEATPIEEVVSGTLTANVLTTIPDDEAVRESIAVGEPLVSYGPHSEAAAGYRELARQLTGRTPQPPEPAATEPAETESSPLDPSSTDLAAETRELLEQSGSQLSDSLSDNEATNVVDPTASTNPTASTDSSDPTQDTTARAEADNDVDHNVVNPFAAEPKEGPSVELPSQTDDKTARDTDRPAPESESKWADAATGTGLGETSTPSSDEKSSESVPQDAIPFGGSDADEDSEDTTETTVLGAEIEAEDGDGDGATQTADSEANSAADEPLIPDAEGGSTDADETAEPEISVDEPDDDEDDEEKRGFFSRLFR